MTPFRSYSLRALPKGGMTCRSVVMTIYVRQSESLSDSHYCGPDRARTLSAKVAGLVGPLGAVSATVVLCIIVSILVKGGQKIRKEQPADGPGVRLLGRRIPEDARVLDDRHDPGSD